jgi:hypothetical protein
MPDGGRNGNLNPKFSSLSWLRVTLEKAAMFLYDDWWLIDKPKPRTFTHRFGREKGIKKTPNYTNRHPQAIVTNPNHC